MPYAWPVRLTLRMSTESRLEHIQNTSRQRLVADGESLDELTPEHIPRRRADAGFPPDLRHAGPQQVTERAAVRLVIEHGYGHEDDHARVWRFSVVPWDNRELCPGTTVQQQSAATAPYDIDPCMTVKVL